MPEIFREYCQKLIEKAGKETSNNNYTSAFGMAKYYIGIMYSNISNFRESLDYFQKAFAITQRK